METAQRTDLSPLSCAQRMKGLIEQMAPWYGLISSPALDRRVELICQSLPGCVVHEYPAGTEIGSWIVPPQWSVSEGFMKDAQGRTIASIAESPLFVAAHSESVDGFFSKKEIERHLQTSADNPRAFLMEHRNAYNYQLVDWGITLPFERWQKLSDSEKYHIKIEVKREPGTMKVVECFLPGESSQIFNISAHFDELCNDDLSGCVVAIELMRWLQQKPGRKYSYQMTLAPELVGMVAYVCHHPAVVRRTLGMLNLETTGAGDGWCLKKAHQDNAYIYKVLRLAAQSRKMRFQEVDFYTGYRNDEWVYAWPTQNIPGVAIQRFPFKQYHTSDDTPAIVSEEYLAEALEVAKKFIDILECDYVPRHTGMVPPWLSRYNLYYDATYEQEVHHTLNNLVLYNIDGKNSLVELASRYNIDFFALRNYLAKFVAEGFVEQKDLVFNGNR